MNGAHRSILIADDEAGLRKVFALAFERAGYRVLLACDGDEALHVLETECVDAVLLDILMPSRDGLETLRHIRRSKPDLHVFIMSGGSSAGHEYLDVARKFGATAAVRKPYLPSKLVEMVDRALDANPKAAAQ